MKALVTGATGFIGGNLALTLLKDGWQVRALVRREGTLNIEHRNIEIALGDVRDREAVETAVEGCDAVFHVAAVYSFWHPEPQYVYNVNVGGTTNVLEAALSAKVPRVVYTSTVSTIGLAPGGGLGREDLEPMPGQLVGHYKKSKYQAEQEARRLAREGLPVVIVNPTAPMGVRDVKPSPTGKVVLDFLRGKMPAYISTGLNIVDVEDVARGHILAMEKGRPGERYILGNKNMTLKAILDILARISGNRPPRVRMPYWVALATAYVDHWVQGKLLRQEPAIPLEGVKIAKKPMWVDCSKAVRELGLPQTPAEEALAKAVGWYKANGYV